MAIRVQVGGVDRGDYLDAESPISWEDAVNSVGSLSALFRSRFGDWRPEDGQEIVVLRDEPVQILTSDGAAIQTADGADIVTGPDHLFGGILLEPAETEDEGTDAVDLDGNPESGLISYSCSATEYSAICDRRLVNAVYESMYLGDIVRQIVRDFLTGEGIQSWGVVALGPLVEKAVFNQVTVTAALNSLADLTGCPWRIDPYKVLQMQPWETFDAPADLDGDTLLAGTITVTPDRQKYRNHQIVRAGTDLTDPRPETLVGDGAKKVFATAFPVGEEPTIEVSLAGGPWVEKTVGILGIEEGFDFYWNKGQAQVSQDDAGAVLAAPTNPAVPATGDRLRVTYRGLFPVLTQFMANDEIAARAAVEGGSGIYSSVEDHPEINSAQSAIDTAIALISRYGKIAKTLDCTTRLADFVPGMVATVNLPRHRLVGERMLIDSVSAAYQPELGEVWYTLHAISGDPFGGWQAYFRKLAQVGKQMVVGREGETLVLLRPAASATVTIIDVVAASTQAPESRIGFMEVGTGEIGA